MNYNYNKNYNFYNDKIVDERNIEVLLFNLRQVILIPSFRIVNMLCCGDRKSLSHERLLAL